VQVGRTGEATAPLYTCAASCAPTSQGEEGTWQVGAARSLAAATGQGGCAGFVRTSGVSRSSARGCHLATSAGARFWAPP
jgi:hypothetical protein